MDKIRTIIKKFPHLERIFRKIFYFMKKLSFQDSKSWWEKFYSGGGNSGAGSYGVLAQFKAQIINDFVKKNKIKRVIEFGCGDGNQLSMFKIPNYTGLDVSKTIIQKNIKYFRKDKTKNFFLYDPETFSDNTSFFNTDLVISLDVIYHIIEDNVFNKYMKDLFNSSKKFVIIYSSNTNKNSLNPPHVKHREFSRWINSNLHNWELIEKIKNKYPHESFSDFFIYKKRNLK